MALGTITTTRMHSLPSIGGNSSSLDDSHESKSDRGVAAYTQERTTVP